MRAANLLVPHFNLKIGGAQAPKQVMDDILDVVVENSLHLPDVCTIRVHDNDFKWLDRDTFREGTKIVVEGGWDRGSLRPLFHGEVSGLELDLAGGGVTTLVVRCYDQGHRLHRGRLSRAFVGMKDSDIVKKIGGEAGFDVKVKPTSQVHDWVIQNNQTNWEFLTERAERNGFRMFVQGEKTLRFEKVEDEADQTIELKWGGLDLRSFRPRTSASPQVDEVHVQGWDPKTKRKIVGICKKPSGLPQIGEQTPGGEVAKKAFGSAKMIVVDRPVHSQQEAEDMARSIFDQIAGEFLTADGLCDGRTDLKPGVAVEIKNIGKRFSGKYYVTSTLHAYTPSEGYTTQFTVSGKTPSNLLSVLDRGATTRSGLKSNIAVAIVTDNKDPDGMGRVKVKYPWLTEDHTSFWARTASQMAGKGRGMFNLPEIDDEVLVAFEHGEISRPYVIGMLWNGQDSVASAKGNPVHGPSSEVNRRGFHTRIGHQMNFDDTGGKGNIQLLTSGGHEVIVDDAGKKVSITTTGGHKLVLDDASPSISATTTGNHSLKLDDVGKMITMSTTGGQSLKMIDPGNTIIMSNATGDTLSMVSGIVNLTAMQMLTLSAPVINVTGAIAVNVAALNTNIAAGALATMNAGAMVQIAGGMAVDVKSALIKLNS